MTLEADRLAVVDVVLPLALTAEVTVTGRRTFQKPCRGRESLREPDRNRRRGVGRRGHGQAARRPSVVAAGEVLETVPGLVISQHSGEGKANQYYLRGFNLDHGTDFAVSVAGIPVNMPTHGHGQGWSDVNFLIPELVSGVQFKKGPYYADEGDFSTAGAANINYVNALERPLLRLTGGGNRFGRMLAAASPRLASGHLLVAIETGSADGPWENPEDYRRLNGVVRYSRGDTRQGTRRHLHGVRREMDGDRSGSRTCREQTGSSPGSARSMLRTGGRRTATRSLPRSQRSGTASTTKVLAFAMDYGLDLFSNFTYLLNDPVNGDQFEQVDNRRVFGVRASHRRRARLLGRALEHSVGLQVRHDRIGPLGLFATRQRRRLSVNARGSRQSDLDGRLLPGRARAHGQVQGRGRPSWRSLPLRRPQQHAGERGHRISRSPEPEARCRVCAVDEGRAVRQLRIRLPQQRCPRDDDHHRSSDGQPGGQSDAARAHTRR